MNNKLFSRRAAPMLRRATSLNPVDAAQLSYGIRVWQASGIFFWPGLMPK
jgi:hypothetical protein